MELSKAKQVALTSAREKMEFEITPFFPYLSRLSSGNGKSGAHDDRRRRSQATKRNRFVDRKSN